MIQLLQIEKLTSASVPAAANVVFGGTFDPFHVGHLDVTRSLLKFFKSVLIAPTGQNPWKAEQPTNFEMRVQMIEMILQAEQLSNSVQICHTPYIYAEELLTELRNNDPATPLYWAVGEDSAEGVANWRNWDKVGVPTIVCPIRIDVHATEIRTGNKPIHPAIKGYVEQNRLYETATGSR